MLRLKKILLLSLFLISFVKSFAQVYPVQTFLQITPPYSGYLPDYTDPFNSKMQVYLTFNDFTIPSYQVKLRVKIEGNGYTLQTPAYLNTPAINLQPGIPNIITGSDLAFYLQSQNLQFTGLNAAQYEQTKTLPEGAVNICIEVLDFNSPTPKIVGNLACMPIWVSLYDPPLTNTPLCGEKVMTSNPQMVLFSWTALHLNSPFGNNNTQYKFELFEVRQPNQDPNQTVLNSLPIYTTYTDFTFLNYGITEPPLQLGMDYVWRVQAIDMTGRDHFKNKGWSPVCFFTYGSVASSLIDGISLQLSASGTGTRMGKATWNTSAVFEKYQLEYRKTGNPNYMWFYNIETAGTSNIYKLEPETEYECRVRGILGSDTSLWSNVAPFTTQPVVDYACNNTIMPYVNPNAKPHLHITKGMMVTVGQFEMIVMDVNASPKGLGYYNGFSKVLIPFLFGEQNVGVSKGLYCSFTDLLIDENLMVQDGEVVALSKGVSEFVNQGIIDYYADHAFYLQNTISNYDIQNNGVLITLANGETVFYEFQGDAPISVADENGNIFIIYPNGHVIEGPVFSFSSDVLAGLSKNQRVDFIASTNDPYGTDVYSHPAFHKSYEIIKITDSLNYFVTNKSIEKNEVGQIPVAAKIEIENFKPDSLVFKNQSNIVLNHSLSGDIAEININKNTQLVYAYYNNQKVGKLNIYSYTQKTKKLLIVPVNGATVLSQQEIENELNQTYKQAAVVWEVTIANNFSNTEWDLNNDGKIDSVNANLFNKYNAEMRKLRDVYLADENAIQPEDYIIFAVPGFINPDVHGYMVRGKNLGFIKSNTSANTIAHELGHGAFGLEHTFPQAAKNSTQNLMDYSSNNQLHQKQWDRIHDFLPTFSLFDDEEDGWYNDFVLVDFKIPDEFLEDIDINSLDFKINSDDIFKFNDGIYFQFPINIVNSISSIKFQNKCVISFVKDSVEYIASYNKLIISKSYETKYKFDDGQYYQIIKGKQSQLKFVCNSEECKSQRDTNEFTILDIEKNELIKVYTPTNFIYFEPYCNNNDGYFQYIDYINLNNKKSYSLDNCTNINDNDLECKIKEIYVQVNNNIENFLNQENVNQADLKEYIENKSNCWFYALNNTNRINCLNLLVSDHMLGDHWIWWTASSIGTEEIGLKLLRYISAEDIETFLPLLNKQIPIRNTNLNTTILERLIYKIDGENYDELVKILLEYYQIYYQFYSESDPYILHYTKDKSGLGNGSNCNQPESRIIENVEINNDGSISFKQKDFLSCHTEWETPSGPVYGTGYTGAYRYTNNFDVEKLRNLPLDYPVLLTFEGNIGFIVGDNDEGDGITTIIVPAFVLKYASDKEFMDKLMTTVTITVVVIDVLTIAYTPSAIYKAYKALNYLRVLAETAELTITAINLTANIFPNTIEEETLNSFNIIVGALQLTNGIRKSITNVDSKINFVKNNTEFRPLTKTEVDDFIKNYESCTDCFNNPNSPYSQDLQNSMTKVYNELKLYRGVSGVGRFIAKSGIELKTYLDDLVTLPAGKTYNGNLYRSIGKQYNNPIEIHPGTINSNYRYSRPGESGLYLSKTQSGNLTEISHYGDLTNYKTYEYTNVQIDNMLDLTDDLICKQLGVDFDLLTRTSSNLDEAYEFTHEIGTWAANKGYKGIIVPGARGNKDYINAIIFKQLDVDNALGNITPTIINH